MSKLRKLYVKHETDLLMVLTGLLFVAIIIHKLDGAA